MKQIGLLSDTHGWVDKKYRTYFSECDEIWHAGDIGSQEVIEELASIRPLRAVYGNIDGNEIRQQYPKTLQFRLEEVNVMMTHIGGYPGHYLPDVRATLLQHQPQLFICGHSHILRIMYDRSFQGLYMNPGAAGISGFHRQRTLVRFIIDGATIKEGEVIELGTHRPDRHLTSSGE